MVAATASRAAASGQTRIVDLPLRADSADPFTRADVVITGLDHSGVSYEVRLFLNNPDATADTPRDADHGYAGRLTVFGHGGCYGDLGHCDVPAPSTDPTDLRPAHPLTPLDTYVTITDALQRVFTDSGALDTVTLVPVSITPRRSDRGPAPELLHFHDVSLHTYLTPDGPDITQPLTATATLTS